MLKSRKGKETENMIIRKVTAATTQKLLTEHWLSIQHINKACQVLERCKGCGLDQIGEKGSCKKWCRREEVQGSISRFIRKREEIMLELEYEMINGLEKDSKTRPTLDESILEEVKIEDLDIELIKKQRLSQNLKKDLIKRNRKSYTREDPELVFFTDGSLRKSQASVGPKEDHMGVGWVQVDNKEEAILDEGKVGARNWPSSTKAELLAIWYVLLIVPKKKRVKIYTDSAAAIAGVKRSKELRASKHWIKEKNADLKRSIRELVELKEIELELVKVKGHSNSKWNNLADKLAKEGGNIETLDSIIDRPPPNSNMSLCWGHRFVEAPTRQFIKNILDLRTGAEWRHTSAIQKVEPVKKEVEHDWSVLWSKIKSQSGVRCTSMKKNREIATLIKCANEKLPVLKTLALRRPNLYKSSKCIICKEDIDEDQDHLATCKCYKEDWKATEAAAINLAWTTLSEETRTRTSKEEIERIWWGTSEEEKITSRITTIKGLVQEKAKELLQDILLSLKEAKEFITTLAGSAWNGFFENI